MLKNNISIAPFLGANKSLSVGLNPLGFRTASEQLFTTLLPGLNVVTLRIRYYSFYCWLLKKFYINRDKATPADLKRHIRMSELLMALIHAQSDNSGGIPGITRAFEIIARNEDVINFNEDAMPGGKAGGGYWAGGYGAFGSYYAASLQELGIILPLSDASNLYNVTPKNDTFISGEVLAELFEESLGDQMSNLFERCAQKGIVTRQELKNMEPYFQCHNLPNNKERKVLTEMLLQNDRPSSRDDYCLRKDTLRLLLSYLKNETLTKFSELEFARYVYHCYSIGAEKDIAAVGWYAYYLNDSRQYESLNIFDVVLSKLQQSSKPGQWENINEFTSQLADEVCYELNVESKTLREAFDSWENVNEPEDKISHAFFVLLDDYRRNSNYQECKEIIRTYFRKVSNDALDAFYSIDNSLDKTVKQYVKHYLTENIIYNHYSESMRKYSQNRIPTQKLSIENGFVRGLSTYAATHSSPRIDTLRNFAEDLDLIHELNVTENGIELLIRLQND